MCIVDATGDDMTQSQSQPKLTPPRGLLSVMNSNDAEDIQRPTGAPLVSPRSGLESGQHSAGGIFVNDMNDPRDDRVGYVHVNLLRASLSCLLVWRLFSFCLWLVQAS